jgi:uncharacterized protein YndB with AHSA1/START domain
MSIDIIKKTISLDVPCDKVWQAISDAKQFGYWFGVVFDSEFTPGSHIVGHIVPTKVDAEIAKLQEPHAGKLFEIDVDRIEAPHTFSFRWHPFAIDPNVDYSTEPQTLVTFALEKTSTGTQLTISESGFSQIPMPRSAEAHSANDGGWSAQMELIRKYLTAV